MARTTAATEHLQSTAWMALRLQNRLYPLAQSRYGVISRAEAIKEGMSAASIDRRVRSGLWIRVRPGVFRLAGVPVTWESELMAASLWAGRDSFVSHRAAARVWGLDGVVPSLPELSMYTARRGEGVIVHRLRPDDRPRSRTLRGFRVTSVERTLLDLCAVGRPSAAGLAIDDALRRRLTTLPRIREQLDASSNCGRNGCRLLAGLLEVRDERDAAAASRLEKRLLRILKRIEDHEVRSQVPVSDGRRTYYLDFAFPASKLAVEGHSLRWHFGHERWKKDLRRDRRLSVLGWTVLYFPWDDVRFAPDLVEAEVREALRALSSR